MNCKLGDIADITMGQSPKSESYNNQGRGLPLLQGNRTFGRKNPRFDTFTTAPTKIANAGDVIMSVRAPVGDLNITPINMCLGRGLCSLHMKNGNQSFLFYLMKYLLPELLNKENGTVFGSINRSDIYNLQVEIPSDDKLQMKIAYCLELLDDKIEINERINKNLEEQAQAIYNNRFITNANPNWKIGTLSDLIDVKYGKDHKKLADGKYPVFGSGGIIRYVERPLYDKESVLIPRKGSLNNVLYINEPFWSVDTMFYTEMKLPNIAKFIYHYLKNIDLASLNAGSAVPSMTTNIINAMQLQIPDEETFLSFNNDVSPIYNLMEHNQRQIELLISVRDTLLPKLMSGELDVSDLNL
jgi:type I restriction enzyme S subunit